MERLVNFFRNTMIENGNLNERVERLNNNSWNASMEYLRDGNSIGRFYENGKLVNYVYATLYEFHRDFFPKELNRVRGSMAAFLKTIHGFLFLSDNFAFDAAKLQNIIKHRKRRYNAIVPPIVLAEAVSLDSFYLFFLFLFLLFVIIYSNFVIFLGNLQNDLQTSKSNACLQVFGRKSFSGRNKGEIQCFLQFVC